METEVNEVKLSKEFVEASKPMVWLMGHTLATVMGFCMFTLISLIPVGVVALLVMMGLDQPAEVLHTLEEVMLYTDCIVFGAIFYGGLGIHGRKLGGDQRPCYERFEEKQMNELIGEFIKGFEAGWNTCWAPFNALQDAFAHTWHEHLARHQ